ncbi:MAG: PTS sugar transporter subunit IIA [Mycoplasmataceae bacterium]|nr:PTS sugar transporter subunit IIA [Mycoplasmataceae bacterium]
MDFIELLKAENSVRTKVKDVTNWKEAVIEACKPLLETKAITKDYLGSIIASTEQFGAYYIITEQVAMPNASHGKWVRRNSISLVTLAKPIFFPNDDRPINILVALAPVDADFHASQLPQVLAIFEDLENIEMLSKARKPDDVYEILSTVDLNKYLRGDE